MRALILNSGMGSRMGVLTSEHPKCMTEVSPHDTILSHQLRQLVDVGIKEVVMTTGLFDEVLIKYCESLELPLHYTFVKNPVYDKTNYIYSIYCAREYLDDDIILMHGDLVFENEVIDKVMDSETSCMTVSSTLPLPEKDFKAVIGDGQVLKVGIHFFENAMAAQPLYKLLRDDWKRWLDKIVEFCENGNTSVYAENALNELDGACNIKALDVENMLCAEIDNPEDLSIVSARLKEVENRSVYLCFSTNVIHGGHILIIRRAARLGKLTVGVLSDEVVSTYKRAPVVPRSERKALVRSIAGVSRVVDQDTLSYADNIRKYKPDIVVHGDNWVTGFQKPVREEVIRLLAEYGGQLVEFPYSADSKYEKIERTFGGEVNSGDDREAERKAWEPFKGIITAENNYADLDKWIKSCGSTTIMLVCGRSLGVMPVRDYFDNVSARLGVRIVQFSDFTPNPLYDSVVEGVNVFNREGCGAIIAIGGGSAMDVAKCIKLYCNMDPSVCYLEQEIVPNNIPFLAAPTTAGTGSEATRFAVIYYNGAKQSVTHESIIPGTVLMDSSLLKTLPVYQRKCTMFDALCHAIESIWSVNSTDESKAYAREAIHLIMDNMDGYLENDPSSNLGMLMAAYKAGKAINITQTTAGHAMCYKITSLYGLSHGHSAMLCVRYLFPWMLENMDRCADPRGREYLGSVMDYIAEAFGLAEPSQVCKWLDDQYSRLGMSTPSATDEEIILLSSSVNADRLKNNPVALDHGSIEMLYRRILRSS
ncbi:cytidyltransferase-like domain-containing protein [Ruminococcaceae bacterium YRB3002]|nr:cytidyltransferase-like domain-containing protein [Ruminococcaceae bacterium YRB3002]